MPIAVTCECGSKLEIDEKFLGKQILCPDCQRPLPTKAPATPPPLELPDYRRVSGLAILSLILALVGGAVGGGIAAIVVGIIALKQIAAKPTKLEGANYARAGIGLGAFFTFFMVAMLFTPTVLGIDSLLREIAFAGHVQYPPGPTVEGDNDNHMKIVLAKPPGRWAVYIRPTIPTNNVLSNDLIVVNITDDAFIASQFVELLGDEDAETKIKLVLDKFQKSELVNLLGRLNGKSLEREGEVVEKKIVQGKNGQNQEIILDLRLGGIDRRILIQYPANNRNMGMNVLIGVARRNRFERMNEVFHRTFDSQQEK